MHCDKPDDFPDIVLPEPILYYIVMVRNGHIHIGKGFSDHYACEYEVENLNRLTKSNGFFHKYFCVEAEFMKEAHITNK